MKQITNLLLLTVMFCIIAVQSFAQSSLYVSTGANVVVTAGTTFSVDSLALKPSALFTITGLNSVTRDAVATPPPPSLYINRVYHFLQTTSPFSGDITVYYRDAELNGLAENTLDLSIYNGNTWLAYPASQRDGVNNFVTRLGLAAVNLNEVTLTAPGVVLPITLSSFIIQNNNCTALLKWTTSSEQNSKHFEVQHSTDGVTFSSKGIVAASGNSNTEKQYNFTSPLSEGNNYFRLRSVDIDGSSKLSSIVSARSNCNSNVINLYPNPTKNIVNITGLTGANQVRILDNLGQVVRTLKTTNASEKMNVSNLPTGTYIVQVIQNGKVIENKKLVKE